MLLTVALLSTILPQTNEVATNQTPLIVVGVAILLGGGALAIYLFTHLHK